MDLSVPNLVRDELAMRPGQRLRLEEADAARFVRDRLSRFSGTTIGSQHAERFHVSDQPLQPKVSWQDDSLAVSFQGEAGEVDPQSVLDAWRRGENLVSLGGAGFGNHWLVDRVAWEILARSDSADPLIITVDRLEAATGEAIAGSPLTMRFASAALTGSVYYWDIAAGRILRIDDGTAVADSFMPSPPGALNAAERCVGCHTVSPSGRYMVGRLGGGQNIAAVFDLTLNLTSECEPSGPEG